MTDVTAAGAKLYIGSAQITDPNAETQSSLEGATYTEIGRVQSLPSIGDTQQTITYNELGVARTKTLATFLQGQGGDVTVIFDSGDTGQTAAIAALGEDRAYKIELDDAPSGSGTTPTTLFFVGMNTNKAIGLGDGTSVVNRTFSLAINSGTFVKNAA